MRGEQVLVLEQHDVAGGCTHTFEDRGYEFDTGVHYCGGTVCNEGSSRTGGRMILDAMSASAGGIEWTRMDRVYDAAIISGKRYEMPEGKQNLRRLSSRGFPRNERNRPLL